MVLDKWYFNITQNWEVLGDNFDNISLNTLLDNLLQVVDFHFSLLGYLKKRIMQFIDIIHNPNLIIELIKNS